MEHLKEGICTFRQENVRLRSHLLVHIRLYFMYKNKKSKIVVERCQIVKNRRVKPRMNANERELKEKYVFSSYLQPPQIGLKSISTIKIDSGSTNRLRWSGQSLYVGV